MKTTTVRFMLLVVFVLSVLLSACGDNNPVAVDVQTVAGETSVQMSDTDTTQGNCPDGYHVTKNNRCKNNDPFKATDTFPAP